MRFQRNNSGEIFFLFFFHFTLLCYRMIIFKIEICRTQTALEHSTLRFLFCTFSTLLVFFLFFFILVYEFLYIIFFLLLTVHKCIRNIMLRITVKKQIKKKNRVRDNTIKYT